MTPLRRGLLCALGFATLAMPAFGRAPAAPNDDALLLQDQEDQQQQQQQMREQAARAPQGEVAKSAAGRVGERQTREQIAPYAHPMRRISNRIDNRIQSRVRNRIDRNYDPQVNSTSPFKVAEEKTRTTTGQ